MYSRKYDIKKFVVGGLLGLLLAGCATNVGKSVQVSEEQIAKYGSLSSDEAIAALEKRVNEAKNANMPFLAPHYFREASKILSDAQESSNKVPKDQLIGDIAKADAILEKGQAVMALVRSRLATAILMKNQMDADKVPKIYPKEYEKAVGELSGLIEIVELEKTDDIDKDKLALIKSMQALDTRTVQYNALHESSVINEDTQNKEGEKLAPATLAEALRVYQDALNRIAQAPHDDDVVKHAGADAMFAARHARNVRERVLALQNKFKEAVEPIVLEEENRLLGISNALGYTDQRDLPIEKQAEAIAQTAGDIAKKQQENKMSGDESLVLAQRLKEANEALQQTNARLAEKEARLSEKEALLSEKNTQLSDKDAQLKTLNDQNTQLEEQVKLQAAAAKKSKIRAEKAQSAAE